MFTKKDILKWWEDLGLITKSHNDYLDFWKKIDKTKVVIMEKTKGTGKNQAHKIVIMRNAWTHPLELLFFDLECVKIRNF